MHGGAYDIFEKVAKILPLAKVAECSCVCCQNSVLEVFIQNVSDSLGNNLESATV